MPECSHQITLIYWNIWCGKYCMQHLSSRLPSGNSNIAMEILNRYRWLEIRLLTDMAMLDYRRVSILASGNRDLISSWRFVEEDTAFAALNESWPVWDGPCIAVLRLLMAMTFQQWINCSLGAAHVQTCVLSGANTIRPNLGLHWFGHRLHMLP